MAKVYKMLDPQLKAEWVAALRSGDYKQGRGSLTCIHPEMSPTYCCLGVLCDILAKKEIGVTKADRSSYVVYYYEGIGSAMILQYTISKLVFGTENNPCGFLPYGSSLTSLNDQGASFSEIANKIEAEL